jgi:uncharacterized membrane protein YidH (DUF202 family)
LWKRLLSVQYRQLYFRGFAVVNETEKKTPSIFSVLGSVLASMFGVQSNRKREQDFTHGKPSQYIIIGLFVTVAFVLAVWGLVSLVMKLAGV